MEWQVIEYLNRQLTDRDLKADADSLSFRIVSRSLGSQALPGPASPWSPSAWAMGFTQGMWGPGGRCEPRMPALRLFGLEPAQLCQKSLGKLIAASSEAHGDMSSRCVRILLLSLCCVWLNRIRLIFFEAFREYTNRQQIGCVQLLLAVL